LEIDISGRESTLPQIGRRLSGGCFVSAEQGSLSFHPEKILPGTSILSHSFGPTLGGPKIVSKNSHLIMLLCREHAGLFLDHVNIIGHGLLPFAFGS
jgi:hypothetical protein